MIQRVNVRSDENPLDELIIDLDVPRGTKILSNEPYVKEMFDKYMGSIGGLKYKDLNDGDIVSAKITSTTADSVCLEINPKHSITMPIKKDDKKYTDFLTVGSDVKVKLFKNKNGKEFLASFGEAVKESKFNDIKDSIGKPIAYKAKVTELIHGGYYLMIDGVQVFMPGSLGGMNKLIKFEELLNKELIVMPINFSTEKGTIVVSHREYLKTILSSEVDKLRGTENEKQYSGFITGTTKYGIFVELNGCITGLISPNDLDENNKIKFTKNQFKPGEEISFYVKDIISDSKIMFSQCNTVTADPWLNIDKYVPQQKVKGKITKIKSYGAFVEIENGIFGLISSNDYKDNQISENSEIDVIIQKIDKDNKKIILTLV